jgi:hypothetical protein
MASKPEIFLAFVLISKGSVLDLCLLDLLTLSYHPDSLSKWLFPGHASNVLHFCVGK